MSQTDAMKDTAGHAADYAIDLSRNGISLYERVDATGWKLVETVPLQVGTLAKNLEHLKVLAGGRDGIAPLVEVWLPPEELKVCCIDFNAAASMEAAVFDTFAAAGVTDPLSMSYDFQPALDDGTTPVAGIPADVLREARDFLQVHGFEPGLYTTAELPRHFARPPEFPLLDDAPVAEPAPAPEPIPQPVAARPAPPPPAPKPAKAKAAAKPIAVKPRTAPEARPKPELAASLKVRTKQTTPLAAKLLAGGAVAAMIGLAAVGLPMLMAPADTRHLPGERAQTADTLATPPTDAPSGSGLPPVASLDAIAGPSDVQGLSTELAAAEAQPQVPEADSFNALIRPDLPDAPGQDSVATALPDFTAARQASALPQIEFSDTLVLLDQFKSNVMTSAISPPLPGEDQVAQAWPGILALPDRAGQPGTVDRADPMLHFGRFQGEVQTIPDALAAKIAPGEDEPVTVALHAGEDIRPGMPVPASRSDLALNVGEFLSDVQTDTLAPRRIVRTDEGVTTYVAELDLNGGRRAVQPLPMLRDDPALSLGRFEGTVQSVPGGIAGLTQASAEDRRLPQIGTAQDSALSAKNPVFISRLDPAHELARFEGQVVLTADVLSPDNRTSADAAPRLGAQPPAADPVRLAMALPTDDPTTRLAIFTAPVQSVIGGLATTKLAIDVDDRSAAPVGTEPVRIAALGRLDLVDGNGVDEVLAHARIIQPFAGQAPVEDVLTNAGFALPIHISSKSPSIDVASLQLSDSAPGQATALEVPDQITLAEPGRSILDGGLLSPDLQPSTGAIPGLTDLPSRPAAKPAAKLAALQSGLDQPLPEQALPPALPDPTRMVTPNRVLVITSRPDIVPALRPRPEEAEIFVASAEPGEVPLVEVTDDLPDVVPPARAEEILAAVTEGETGQEDEAEFQLAAAPTDHADDPLIAVITGRPAVVPPARPGEVVAETDRDVAETLEHVTDKGVLVLAALPPVVPPNRFGAAEADDSTMMVLEPTADQLEIAALMIKAQREGDLAPTNFALSKASAPLHRPKGMVEEYRQREIELASLVPSDIALSTADSPRSRPDNLKVVAPRPGVTPNVDIKASTYSPGPQLPTVANVAREATISNALPMREMSLIGVFGSSKNRHALLRLPGGKMVKVAPGDTVRGYQVTAISPDAIRLNRRGKDTLLVIPD